jgi:hypothetical protein
MAWEDTPPRVGGGGSPALNDIVTRAGLDCNTFLNHFAGQPPGGSPRSLEEKRAVRFRERMILPSLAGSQGAPLGISLPGYRRVW